MADRTRYTPEQRARERAANRERMRRANAALPPGERSRRARERRQREAATDPETIALRKARRSAAVKRYYEKRKGDPAFWRKRDEYLRRWRAERRVNEQFEAFMARIEEEAGHAAAE